MNKMKEFAKMFGVEEGESFKIFMTNGLERMHSPVKLECGCLRDCRGNVIHGGLEKLISGDYKVVKLKNPYEEFVTAQELVDSGIEVKVDDKIIVRFSESHISGFNRHFAKIKNGRLYAYDNGSTSHTGECISVWNLVKLVK